LRTERTEGFDVSFYRGFQVGKSLLVRVSLTERQTLYADRIGKTAVGMLFSDDFHDLHTV